MTLTLGGIAAICLAAAIAFTVKKLAKRTVVFLMIIAGLAGLGGVLGSIIARVTQSGVNGATSATNRLLGVGAGGLIVMLVLTIFIYPHVKLKGAQPPTKATPWLGLAWGSVAAAVGGVFGAAAGVGTNVIAQGANLLLSGATAFFQGF
jgi:hypothetical protein